MNINDKIEFRDMYGNTYTGRIISVNEYREPSMRYAVLISGYGNDTPKFIGEEQIIKKVEMNEDDAIKRANSIAHEAIANSRYTSQMTTVNHEPEGIEITTLMFDGSGTGLKNRYQSEVHKYDDVDWNDFAEFMKEVCHEKTE